MLDWYTSEFLSLKFTLNVIAREHESGQTVSQQRSPWAMHLPRCVQHELAISILALQVNTA